MAQVIGRAAREIIEHGIRRRAEFYNRQLDDHETVGPDRAPRAAGGQQVPERTNRELAQFWRLKIAAVFVRNPTPLQAAVQCSDIFSCGLDFHATSLSDFN